MDQRIKQKNIFCMALIAGKCGIMDSTIYSGPVMYSYFTHPAELDNFMLLSPQLAWPANQCPLKRLSVHMSLDPFALILLLRRFPALLLNGKQYNCSVCYVHALEGCYRQMLIMITPLPPVPSHRTDNESDNLCSAVVAGYF